MQDQVLLQVKNLKTYFHHEDGDLKAVDDVSFSVKKGETFGIVGESGCGKSITCMSIIRLVDSPPGYYAGGEILFEGQDTLKMDREQLRKLRGGEISVIFQEPMTALNPVYTIGNQMEEAILLHRDMPRQDARLMAVELLREVKIPNPEQVVNRYPFSLSGGMRQRVVIAMALACQPKLVIADEPTTALDVTIQAQILDLMNTLKQETGTSIIFITHDLGVISEMADRVMVMYGGKVCELAQVDQLFEQPMHPYTKGLIRSKPSADLDGDRLTVIPGSVPSLKDKPSGCPFHPRCESAMPRCKESFPPERIFETGRGEHKVSCWLYEKEGASQ